MISFYGWLVRSNIIFLSFPRIILITVYNHLLYCFCCVQFPEIIIYAFKLLMDAFYSHKACWWANLLWLIVFIIYIVSTFFLSIFVQYIPIFKMKGDFCVRGFVLKVILLSLHIYQSWDELEFCILVLCVSALYFPVMIFSMTAYKTFITGDLTKSLKTLNFFVACYYHCISLYILPCWHQRFIHSILPGTYLYVFLKFSSVD